MQLVNHNISVSIPSFKEDKSSVSYIIEIKTRDNRSWQVSKRYSQFEDLNKKLAEVFQNLPTLPKKSYVTFFMGKSKEELEIRRKGLEDYLRQLIVRREIYHSDVLREYLKLEQCDELSQPNMTQEHSLTFGVRDFVFASNYGLLFVLSADMSVMNRVDAYVNNFKMPWNDNQDDESKKIPVGMVECFEQTEDGFKRLWSKDYSSQAICMFWDTVQCVLLVGLDSGKINYIKLSSKTQFRKLEESIEIEMHYERVMGVFGKQEQIHSISKDTHYKVLDLERAGLIADIELSQYELTQLIYSEERDCSIIGDRNGCIFVINLKPSKPQLILSIETETLFIRGLYLDHQKNYLMCVSYDNGIITVIDLNKGLSEEAAKIKTKFASKTKSREVQWSRKRGELFVGNDDGTVTIFNASDIQPIFVLKAHSKAITKLFWHENQNVLITASKDQKIKWWNFPKKWKQSTVEEEIKEKQIIEAKMETLLKIQQQNQKEDSGEGSDDDGGLGTWHK